MEPCLLNQSEWPPGIVSLYLGSTLYIDCINNNFILSANKIHDYLIKLKLKPKIESKIKFNLKSNNSVFSNKTKKSFNLSSKNFNSFKNNYFKSFFKKEKLSNDSNISNNNNNVISHFQNKIFDNIPTRIAPIFSSKKKIVSSRNLRKIAPILSPNKKLSIFNPITTSPILKSRINTLFPKN